MKKVADILFALQIIGAFVVCGTQFFRMIESVKGVVLSQFVLIEVYALFQLWLAVSADRVKSTRISRQTVVIYATWFSLLLTNVAAVVFLNGTYVWASSDTWTTLAVLLITGVAVVYARKKGLPITNQMDPMIKGVIGGSVKALPQVVMAWKIAIEGASGVPGTAVLMSNINIIGRLLQLLLSVKEAGWDRNRVWMLITESANFVSWLAVSVSFLIWWL